MNTEPLIIEMKEKKFIGKRLMMSFSDNKTFELWQSFMPHRKEIENIVGNELYSIEVYPPSFFKNFNPDVQFEKWAAVEVSDSNKVPVNMENITSPSGRYAVFIHRGPASSGPDTYNYIFRKWLPDSEYMVDSRPHFAVMGEKYRKDDPGSEEELWIPVKLKR